MSFDRRSRKRPYKQVTFQLFASPDSQIRYSSAPEHLELFNPDEGRVTVSAHEILLLLAHATRSNNLWLRDFMEDTMEISRDLFEVLMAYQLDSGSSAA